MHSEHCARGDPQETNFKIIIIDAPQNDVSNNDQEIRSCHCRQVLSGAGGEATISTGQNDDCKSVNCKINKSKETGNY